MKFNVLLLISFAMAFFNFRTHAASLAELKSLVEGNTAFAIDLYGKVRANPGNLALSPYSISSALAMTYAGAQGDTAQQMESTLHFEAAKTNLHESFGQLNAAIMAAAGTNELTIANSLWPQARYPFLASFLNVLKTKYGTSITPLDYAENSKLASAKINSWVGNKTKQMISDLISPNDLHAMTRLVLVNAIYFKGAWANEFSGNSIHSGQFYLSSEKPETVLFLQQQARFRYAEPEGLQVLVIPYAGQRLEMLLLLPRSRDGLGQLEQDLTPANLAAWTGSTQLVPVHVTVPKFKMTATVDLGHTLAALGITDAFDGARADFSGMDGKLHWLYISKVLHKACVEVNEKGTEAAAATAVAVAGRSAAFRPEPPNVFRADHPFLFLIRDSQTGSILFLGRVADPTAN